MMKPGVQALMELGHYASLLPVAALALFRLQGKELSWKAHRLTAAFFLSFMADQVASNLGPLGYNTYWLSYLYAPVQFGLILSVMVTHPTYRKVCAWSFGVVLVATAVRGVWSRFDQLALVPDLGAGILVFSLVGGGIYRRAVWLYCVATVPFLLAMAVFPVTGPFWLPAWIGYQLVRVGALGSLAWALGEEVGRGPRHRQIARGYRDDRHDLGHSLIPAEAALRVRALGASTRDCVEEGYTTAFYRNGNGPQPSG